MNEIDPKKIEVLRGWLNSGQLTKEETRMTRDLLALGEGPNLSSVDRGKFLVEFARLYTKFKGRMDKDYEGLLDKTIADFKRLEQTEERARLKHAKKSAARKRWWWPWG
jgi:hypothetical protein